MTRLVLMLVVAAALSACARQAPDCGALEVADAWIRAVPADAGMTAGYLVLRNPGSADVRVTGFGSKAFGRAQMHMTMAEHGQATMHHMDTITVPAGEPVAFAPGARHLMLFQPQIELAPGNSVPMHLACGDDRLAFIARVRTRAPVE